MKTLLPTIVSIFVATSVAATQCNFVTECFETDACSETTFSMSIEEGAGGADDIQIVTDSETFSGRASGSEAELLIIASSETAVHFLSVSDDGNARYTTHLQGPLAITYHGTCEATQ